ncbi:IclR family transcriptional regulator [Devosia sp.]|uniref:IclR family transcriptional regulator n=1 Tax=Devosia sp. TaxID=1871048 RepID=UPI002F01C579
MSGVLERTLEILELLARNPNGLPLREIAEKLDIPPSGAHRLLRELARLNYVRQEREQADYVLTTRLVSLALGFLSASGIVDLAQPVLDRLAQQSGELVRLAVVDGDRLTWVAKAQGARTGLRYDPDMGAEAHLASSASGHAWLMTLPDEKALELVASQGFGTAKDRGPNAPLSTTKLLRFLKSARARGFSIAQETFTSGMTGLAAPVRSTEGPAVGVISIYGPTLRLGENRQQDLGEELMAAADELALSSTISPVFRRNSGVVPH